MTENREEEMLEIWDWETGRPTGVPIPRSIAHKEGLPHECVHLWIIRNQNHETEILFQHRSKDKRMYPDCLDITVAGHVPFGLTGNKINKEAYEEIGIDLTDSDLIDLGFYKYEEVDDNFFHREFQRVYLLLDNRPLDRYRFTDNEVTAIYAVKLHDVQKLFSSDTKITAEGYTGDTVFKAEMGRRRFHPQLFDTSMKAYMDVIFRAAEELAAGGPVKTKL